MNIKENENKPKIQLVRERVGKDWITADNILMKPLQEKLPSTILNMMIAFIYKDSALRTRKTLNNFRKLILHIDPEIYADDYQTTGKMWLICKSIEAIVDEGIESPELVMTYCNDQPDATEYTKDLVMSIETMKISYNESKYLINKINDMLRFGYISTVRSIIGSLLDAIDEHDFNSYESVKNDINNIALSIININRMTNSVDSDQTFSLDTELFDAVVADAVKKLKDRNRIFMTGIKKLNVLLAPGYMSKRLYTYLAFPGKGKSTILLKSAIDIKKYNRTTTTKDPDKRPAVLFLTLENDIPETIERIYNMVVDSDDIRNYTPKQIIKKLKKEGQLSISTDNPIDIIIKEYKNQEIDTDDIYTIIDDLNDQGIEVVALVLDYIKRVRAALRPVSGTEKEELKNISNELKEIAKAYDIPVITAQQLNRNGSTVVDAALRANKEDVTKLVGRDAIAGAWEYRVH